VAPGGVGTYRQTGYVSPISCGRGMMNFVIEVRYRERLRLTLAYVNSMIGGGTVRFAIIIGLAANAYRREVSHANHFMRHRDAAGCHDGGRGGGLAR
jgi:hypothetical protein